MGASEEARREVSDGAPARRRARRLTLAVGLALIAAGLIVTLSRDAERRTGTNGMPAKVFLGVAEAGSTLCQTGEQVPAGTAGLRFKAKASSHAAPQLTVTLESGGLVHAEGSDARWDGDDAIVVALGRPLDAPVQADVCVRLHERGQRAYGFKGVPTYPGEGATNDGRPMPGRMHVEYLSAGGGSWWSFASTIGERIGRGHAWSGASVALLAALLVLAPIALTAWQLSRDDS